jgi:hypothetical protein
LLHWYNGLDRKGAVAGLLELISAVRPLPVVLLRSDISAIGMVAHQAFAGFVGWSTSTRHGPLPVRRPKGDDERDQSPSVLVPALNDYLKTSMLPVFTRIRRLEVLRCDDRLCRGDSLLRIADLSETDLRDATQRHVKPANKLASWTARSSLPVVASTTTSVTVSGDSKRRVTRVPSSSRSATPHGWSAISAHTTGSVTGIPMGRSINRSSKAGLMTAPTPAVSRRRCSAMLMIA